MSILPARAGEDKVTAAKLRSKNTALSAPCVLDYDEEIQMGAVNDSKEGHRKRLRERFLQDGLGGFLDYEIVELFLTFWIGGTA